MTTNLTNKFNNGKTVRLPSFIEYLLAFWVFSFLIDEIYQVKIKDAFFRVYDDDKKVFLFLIAQGFFYKNARIDWNENFSLSRIRLELHRYCGNIFVSSRFYIKNHFYWDK